MASPGGRIQIFGKFGKRLYFCNRFLRDISSETKKILSVKKMEKLNHHTASAQCTTIGGITIVVETICKGAICSFMMMGMMFIHTLL